MIHIYLCDDEEAVLHQIRIALEQKIFTENYDMKVVCAAGSARELLEAVEDGRRSVYFLDVDLKDGAWDGFRLGRELRRRDPVEIFSLRTGDETRHVPLTEILFFETAPKAHHVFLHTAHSRMDFVGSLNELERELGERFLRVHRAYLAAADKIEAVDWKGNRVRVGGRECLLSRAGKAELKKKLGGSL